MIHHVFIQLPLFDKAMPEECGDDMDRWFYVFINMSKMESMPFTRENRIFDELSDMAAYASLTVDERRAYDADVKAYRDYVGQLSFAEQRGVKKGLKEGMERGMERGMRKGKLEGLKEGIEKGIEKGKMETAKLLKAAGIDLEIISQSTGLPIATINNL